MNSRANFAWRNKKMGISIRLIVFILFSANTVQAAKTLMCEEIVSLSTPEIQQRFSRGEPLRVADRKTAVVSEEAFINDTPFYNTFLNLQLAYIQSSLGQRQLWWLLRHPSYDPDEIRARQEAIRTLAENVRLRKKIQNLFLRISRFEPSGGIQYDVDQYLRISADEANFLTRFYLHYSNLARAAGHTASTVAFPMMAVSQDSPMPLIAAVFFGILFREDAFRERMDVLPYREVFQVARDLAAELKASPSTELHAIGEILAEVDNPSGALDLARTARALRKVRNPSWATHLADTLGSLYPVSISRDRIRTRSKNVAVVLSVLGELEVFAGLAELKSPDRIFPTILDLDRPMTLEIRGNSQAYHIHSLLIAAQIGAPVPVSHMVLTPFSDLNRTWITAPGAADVCVRGEESSHYRISRETISDSGTFSCEP